MKLEKQKEFPLLSRTRYTYFVDHAEGVTPSKKDMQEKIAQTLKVDAGLVAIRHIFTRYGVGNSRIIAHVYSDKKVLDFLEAKKEKKNGK